VLCVFHGKVQHSQAKLRCSLVYRVFVDGDYQHRVIMAFGALAVSFAAFLIKAIFIESNIFRT